MRYKFKMNGVIAGKELNILLENALKLAFL